MALSKEYATNGLKHSAFLAEVFVALEGSVLELNQYANSIGDELCQMYSEAMASATAQYVAEFEPKWVHDFYEAVEEFSEYIPLAQAYTIGNCREGRKELTLLLHKDGVCYFIWGHVPAQIWFIDYTDIKEVRRYYID